MSNNHTNETFAQRLRRLRNYNDFTQQQIADHLNIDRSTYSYYESGKTEPNYEATQKLCKIFHVSIDELLTGEHTPPSALRDSSPHFPKKTLNDHLTPRETNLLIGFRNLSDEEQQKIFDIVSSDTKKNKRKS